MNNNIYLSIDMDYFYYKKSSLDDISAYFSFLTSLNVPINVVTFHHELVPFINAYTNISTLINIDYHSDFSDINTCGWSEFNEGTWVNYCNVNPVNSIFQWYYPVKSSVVDKLGYCHDLELNHNPFNKKYRGLYRWGLAEKYCGMPNQNIYENVSGIGICVSPNWIYTKTKSYMDLIKSYFSCDIHNGGMVNEYEKINGGFQSDYIRLSEITTFNELYKMYDYIKKDTNIEKLQTEIARLYTVLRHNTSVFYI